MSDDEFREQLKEKLTPEQYRVCVEQGTEAPFTGSLLFNKQAGTYHCVCCDAVLFDAENKFDSGCGWPAFSTPVSEGAVCYVADSSYGMTRTEVRCRNCSAHLGHVFDDGPQPNGQRYCINSVAMQFRPEAADDVSSAGD